ncbi:uncharacterized protein Bfra_005909 [Botrytis fragariae]|uniref:Uncharacterized protein n=1 Tax=Botrytis fragariae TaxID=1964551 RepID=A0A8H6AS40_9HELO|nr:uncharacterized protein Bfra_005909 [Botrytis fragariae]KAF5872548.1 hypothetical protein Bfra_005909 [Botrytis fragariae]
MSSESDSISVNFRAESSPMRPTTHEVLVDGLDTPSPKRSSPSKSSKNKTATPKKQKTADKMIKVPTVYKDEDASDDDNPGHENELSSPKAGTTHGKTLSTAKSVTNNKDGGDHNNDDDDDAEEIVTKKPAAAPKSKSSTTNKLNVNLEEKAKQSDEVTPNVSDADTKKAAPTTQSRKRRAAATSTNGGARKKAKLPANAYNPDCYTQLNREDKLLFDLKTNNPEAPWKELIVQFNLEMQGKPELKADALRMRWPRVKAAATEIEHADIQKMCISKQDMEDQLENTRDELLAKFEREREAVLRKFKTEMWTEIAKNVGQNGGNDYEPAVLQRKYELYKRQGRIDDNDKYLAWTEEDENSVKAEAQDNEEEDANKEEDDDNEDDEEDDEEQAGAQEDANGEDEIEVDIKGEDSNMSEADA